MNVDTFARAARVYLQSFTVALHRYSASARAALSERGDKIGCAHVGHKITRWAGLANC